MPLVGAVAVPNSHFSCSRGRRERTVQNFRPLRLALRRLGGLRLVYGLDAIENLTEIALCDLNVIVVLQVEPKLCGCASALASRNAVSAVIPICSLATRWIRVPRLPGWLRLRPHFSPKLPEDRFDLIHRSARYKQELDRGFLHAQRRLMFILNRSLKRVQHWPTCAYMDEGRDIMIETIKVLGITPIRSSVDPKAPS